LGELWARYKCCWTNSRGDSISVTSASDIFPICFSWKWKAKWSQLEHVAARCWFQTVPESVCILVFWCLSLCLCLCFAPKDEHIFSRFAPIFSHILAHIFHPPKSNVFIFIFDFVSVSVFIFGPSSSCSSSCPHLPSSNLAPRRLGGAKQSSRKSFPFGRQDCRRIIGGRPFVCGRAFRLSRRVARARAAPQWQVVHRGGSLVSV